MRALLPLLVLALPALAEAQAGPGFCYERTYAAAELGTDPSKSVSRIRIVNDPSAPSDARLIRARVVATMAASGATIDQPALCQSGPGGRVACQIVGELGGFVATPRGDGLVVTVGGGGLFTREAGEYAYLPGLGVDRRFVLTPCG